MSDRADGMNYAPKGKRNLVVKPGEFVFSVIGLDHGHIFGMTNGLLEAGAVLKNVHDPDKKKVAQFIDTYPQAKYARREDILNDAGIHLVASAVVPCDRCDLGVEVMRAGKHYFADKPPITSLDQLVRARAAAAHTGRRFVVYFSERLHVESAVYAGELVQAGEIGKVIQVIGLGPHRINLPSRPPWFFDKSKYGGLLVDVGCHQIEQYLFFSGATDATVTSAQWANYSYADAYPLFEDFADCNLLGDNGTTNYFRIDWYTPEGLGVWGDGRTVILGTEGYLELRKYIDVGRSATSDHVYLVNNRRQEHIEAAGTTGFPFFGQLIRDCLNGTSTSMTQEYIFKAVELSLLARDRATRLPGFAGGAK